MNETVTAQDCIDQLAALDAEEQSIYKIERDMLQLSADAVNVYGVAQAHCSNVQDTIDKRRGQIRRQREWFKTELSLIA